MRTREQCVHGGWGVSLKCGAAPGEVCCSDRKVGRGGQFRAATPCQLVAGSISSISTDMEGLEVRGELGCLRPGASVCWFCEGVHVV